MTADHEDRLGWPLVKLAGILILGGIAPFLDTTIVNVAVPTIADHLETSVATVQWVITGYLLALGMAVPLTGWAQARFGGKNVWTGALGIFLAGSMLSGLAWDPPSLIAFRVLQGIGGGLMQPVLMTLLIQAAGRRRIGRLIGIVTLVVVIAPILGPVAGGLIVSNLTWRWVFYVNAPICVAAVLLAWRGLPASPRQPGQHLDLPGLLMLSPSLALLIYGLSGAATDAGFATPSVVLPLAAGAILLTAFVIRALRPGVRPVLDLRLFRIRSFGASAALMFLAGISLYGALFLLPLYYERVDGETTLWAGLLLAPQGVGSLLTRWAGALTDRIGPRPVVLAGMVLAALGTLVFTQVGSHPDPILLAVALVVRGGGLSAATMAITAGAYRDLSREQVADASSATRILQQIGGAVGTAVLAMILARQLAGHPPTGAVQAGAFGVAFWWAVGFTAVALLPAFLLPGRRRGDLTPSVESAS